MDIGSPSQRKKSSGLRSGFRNIFPRSAPTASCSSLNPPESFALPLSYSSTSALIPPSPMSTTNTATSSTPVPPSADQTASRVPAKSSNTHLNEYTAIGGVTTTLHSLTPGQRMKERGVTAYRGLIAIVQALSDCSDIFLPLKTACNVILTIQKMFDVREIRRFYAVSIHNLSGSQRLSTNRDQLQELEGKLAAILEVVTKYREYGAMGALQNRIKMFCQCVGFSLCSDCCDVRPRHTAPSNFK